MAHLKYQNIMADGAIKSKRVFLYINITINPVVQSSNFITNIILVWSFT